MPPRPLIRSSGRRPSYGRSRWLPAPLREGLLRLVARLEGGAVIAPALAVALALVSYTPEDVSWNAASSRATGHLFGAWGGMAADILWQFFGLAGLWLSVILAAWGWRIATQRGLDLFWRRSLAALLSMLSAGIALAALNPLSSAIETRFWGGAFGHLLAREILAWISASWGGYLVAFVMGFLSIATLYMASALTFGEWQSLGRLIHDLLYALVGSTWERIASLWRRLRRPKPFFDNERDDEEDEEESEEEDEDQ